ncbi:MAG: hypothetical protein ACI4VF_10415 [Lachnospirales bacterium]
MSKIYEKPNLIIKNYHLKTQIMLSENNFKVYDTTNPVTAKYTLGTLND